MKRLLQLLWRQVQLVYRLTFQPDLDSAIYLNRTRLNIAALTMLGLDAIYTALWIWVFDDTAGSAQLLALAAGTSLVAFLNLQWRFIPKISQLAVVIFCLWLNMPVLALYIYVIVDPPVKALANTIVLLMLYMHLQDWRSSLLGVILAAAVVPFCHFLSMGSWPAWPPLLQIFILCSAMGGAVIVAASSANITKMRKRYAQKVLRVTQEQLRPALQLQTELLGNMRYEARNILQDERQRLAVDRLAQNLEAQIVQLQGDVARLVRGGGQPLGDWQAIGMLRSSDIVLMTRQDLMASYHFLAEDLDAALLPHVQDDVIIEANGAEISQALSALLAAMLKAAGLGEKASATPSTSTSLPPVFILHCWQHAHMGKLRISLQAPEQPAHPDRPSVDATADATEGVRSAQASEQAHPSVSPHHSLPPFTAYIFRLFHVRWQIHAHFANGAPSDITLSCPLPSHSGAGQPASTDPT
jgi:hypothetical protein